MSIEGGDYRCTLTDFHTPDPLEFNKHAEECDNHRETGSTVCISCGTAIEYEHIPFRPMSADGSKGIALQCENCMSDMMSAGSIKSSKKEKAKEAKQ